MDGDSRTGHPLKAAVKFTYEDYRTTSDDQRYELLDGGRTGVLRRQGPVSHEAVGVRRSAARRE